jgi:hypothetical protein
MPGFNNGVVWADNVRFDGSAYPGQVTTDGQLLIGSTVAPNIRVSTLTAGPGVGIVNGSGSITISAGSVSGTAWSVVSSPSNPITLVSGDGYIPKGAGGVIFLLPAVAAVGDTFNIAGYGNLWTVTQNVLQSITLGAKTSTVGIFGSITATNIRDSVEIICVTANTEFQIINSIGNITIA